MKKFFAVLFSTLFLFSFSNKSEKIQSSQSEISGISKTRQLYLEKASPIERRIAEIDLKWNWIVATPSEDSIAKAQGWYVFMGAQKDQLKRDLLVFKIEQLKNYYQDILDLHAGQESEQVSAISAMEQNRATLAPAYPLLNVYIPSSDIEIETLTKWVIDYPQQYLDLTLYLEKLVLNA